MEQNSAQVLLAVIAGLITLAMILGGVIGKMIVSQLNNLAKTNSEQWEILWQHGERLTALDGGKWGDRVVRRAPAVGETD